ncbi:unnamed protein product [marine sediment metagenome]|uniref:Uncharacterized protein n=1 Tax=marine sediment metagenome TaxID=412755 RepID=X1T2F8_9ZZZZ
MVDDNYICYVNPNPDRLTRPSIALSLLRQPSECLNGTRFFIKERGIPKWDQKKLLKG